VKEICHGCRYAKLGTIRVTVLCMIARAQSEETCPCGTCLVKVMCSRNCDIRDKQRQEITEWETHWWRRRNEREL
jgi:hypothetical protein